MAAVVKRLTDLEAAHAELRDNFGKLVYQIQLAQAKAALQRPDVQQELAARLVEEARGMPADQVFKT
jgi:hypothetical protein